MEAQGDNAALDIKFNDNPGKANFFKDKTNEELERLLDVYLVMDNGGGKIAEDIIDELFHRQEAKDLGTPVN